MKNIIILLVLFSSISIIYGRNGEVGKIWPSEKHTWVDDSTGYEITQWTKTGENWHLYFNIESFMDNTHAIINSDRAGNVNFFKLDLSSGEMTQMTDEKGKISGTWHIPDVKTLWYMVGKDLKALNTETSLVQTVYTFDDVVPESFAVTKDAKWFVYAANKHSGWTANKSTGPYALFKLNLETKIIKQISPDYGFMMSHVQTNPADTNLISFCWQHQYREGGTGIVGNAPVRIWWNNLSGTDGGPVGPQEFGIHRTHEFWFPDGKLMGFSARYLYGPNKGKQFIGITSLDSKKRILLPANVSAAHNQIFKDEKHWISDQFNGPYLVLFTLGNDKISETKILFRHDSSWGAQPTHPHPHFSPDGKYVMFSTDESGTPQVYTVKIDLQKKK